MEAQLTRGFRATATRLPASAPLRLEGFLEYPFLCIIS